MSFVWMKHYVMGTFECLMSRRRDDRWNIEILTGLKSVAINTTELYHGNPPCISTVIIRLLARLGHWNYYWLETQSLNCKEPFLWWFQIFWVILSYIFKRPHSCDMWHKCITCGIGVCVCIQGTQIHVSAYWYSTRFEYHIYLT